MKRTEAMRATFIEIYLAVACCLASAAAFAQQPPAEDTSPHTAQFIEVETGVKLEVLDWGGSGPDIVMLAGLGMTAHDFDQIAPKLLEHGRVVAITRRGYGASSRPTTGYDFPRLTADVLAVMDAMKLGKPILVGHSIAGQELSLLGVAHPQRFAGLVYLDGAFDYTDEPPEEYTTLLKAVTPDSPALRFNMNKRLVSLEGLPQYQQILFSTLKPNYSKIGTPALSFVAIASKPSEMFPDYDQRDADARSKMDRMFEISVKNAYMQRDKFLAAPKSKAIDLIGANHFVHKSREDEVVKGIVEFVDQVKE
jgi:pimeloyl-ACP methyl ester carboxylesterase